MTNPVWIIRSLRLIITAPLFTLLILSCVQTGQLTSKATDEAKGKPVQASASIDKERGPNYDCDPPIHGQCVMSRKMQKWNGNAYQIFDGITPGSEGTWPFVVRAYAGIREVTIHWEGDAELFENARLHPHPPNASPARLANASRQTADKLLAVRVIRFGCRFQRFHPTRVTG